MGTETPYLSGVFRFVARLHTLSKRGMRMALAGQPKCRYGMLQSLYNLIEQHGCDGAIYVSDIARQMHQPMPAISRGLRQMEQTGHIVRETDPKDRRKTLVRITPAATPALALLLCLHLGAVMALFATMPYGKFAHGIFRTAALLRHNTEKRRPNPIGLGSD